MREFASEDATVVISNVINDLDESVSLWWPPASTVARSPNQTGRSGAGRPIKLVRNGTTGQVEHFDNELPTDHRAVGARGTEAAPAEAGKPAAGSMDYLDIPAFLRRQAD
ncbi:MAG: hypothetical protein H7A20_09715 [Rhodanobacteraceae bacterium]|nr:hypothetical protein [Rhodanobacteraceae bacterium]